MKKIISAALCLSMLLCCAFGANAACTHSYTHTYIEADCRHRAYTKSVCNNCGDTYKTYDSLYTAPDGCYFLLEGEREGDVLKVTVTLYNNPGFWANRLTLSYNADALQVVTTEKGDVWPSNASVSVNEAPASGSPYVRFYCDSTTLENNVQNGILFSVSFSITGETADWGLSLSAKSRDNINVEGQAVPFTIVDTATLGYGDHVYDGGKVITEPTYVSAGAKQYACTVCKETKTEELPALEKIPGDANLNGKYDSNDMIIIKRHIAGMKYPDHGGILDANLDGRINAKDLLLVKKIFLGII